VQLFYDLVREIKSGADAREMGERELARSHIAAAC